MARDALPSTPARSPQYVRVTAPPTTRLFVATLVVCGTSTVLSLVLSAAMLVLFTPVRRGDFLRLGGDASLTVHVLGLLGSILLTLIPAVFLYRRTRDRLTAAALSSGAKRLTTVRVVTRVSVALVVVVNALVLRTTLADIPDRSRRIRVDAASPAAQQAADAPRPAKLERAGPNASAKARQTALASARGKAVEVEARRVATHQVSSTTPTAAGSP